MSYFLPWDEVNPYRHEFAAIVRDSDPYRLTQLAWDHANKTDTINRLLACDIKLYLPGDLLPKVDITTMAVSLEARNRLLDQHLMKWAASLPGDLKVNHGITKYLFKKALEPWLPSNLIHRNRMGFEIPRDEWLRGPLQPMVHDLLCSSDTRIATYLEPEKVSRWVTSHEQYGNARARVWALLMLELWHRVVQEVRV